LSPFRCMVPEPFRRFLNFKTGVDHSDGYQMAFLFFR